MNILMVSAEMAPFAKVGGLADVTTSLAQALASRDHDVRVVLPLYGHLDRRQEGVRVLKKLPPLALRVGQQMHDVRVHLRGSGREAVKVYLVECEAMYGAGGIYPAAQDGTEATGLARASLHAQAALLLPRLLDWPVDVVHAHDAEAALALVYRRQWYGGRPLPGAGGLLLTIHNLAHQEIHAAAGMATLGLPLAMGTYPGLLEYHGQLNLLKAGILTADRVTTVSPSYAQETVHDPVLGCGLAEVLAGRGADYTGILNGADYDDWNPRTDPALPAGFDGKNLAGRATCRRALQRELRLADAAGPICGFVGRLVPQKGVDLLLPLLDRLVGDGFSFAVLGTGDVALGRAMTAAAARHPKQVAYVDAFDEALARRIYAGCDTFLMPSRFEPCGLSQMYALRYGAPPVVRRTGGLADTVVDADEPNGDGYVFVEAHADALLAALRRVEADWRRGDAWAQLQARGMARSFSWSQSAAAYEDLYRQVGDDL